MTLKLIKKQMLEIFRSYFYDSKKNKKRSKLTTALFIVMYIGIMVGVLGGMFTYLSLKLCKPFHMVNMDWMFFLIMSMIAVALGASGSVFNTFSGLYMSKDNDLLLSLPIPTRAILISRLMGVYIMGLMYSGVVIVPAAIVYLINVKITPANILGTLLMIIIISAIVLVLSCILGWCVAKISIKLKNKSFITVIISLVFFGLYYFVYFKAQKVIQDLMENALIYGSRVKKAAHPLYLFGNIPEGDIKAIVIFTVITIIICLITFYILCKSFIKIVTSGGKSKKVTLKTLESKKRSIKRAILGKEFGKLVSSPNYMLNCGLGSVFLIILCGFLIIKGSALINNINKVIGAGTVDRFATVCVALAVCLLITMNDMVTPAVSLEGKNIWILQSLPVNPWDVLKAKISVQILVTGIPAILCSFSMIFVLKCNIAEMVLAMILPVVFTVFMSFFGMFLGLCMPNMTWTNELAPIKQSISVLLSMFGGWAIVIAAIGIYLLKAWRMGAMAYLLIMNIVFIIGISLLYMWVKNKGTKIFRQL